MVMLQSDAVDLLSKALVAAQPELKSAPFTRTNPHFKSKYAELPAVIDVTRPVLKKHGLCITQTSVVRDGLLILVTALRHESGQWIAGEYPVPIGKPQDMGSALTYARRYSLAAICCIASEEDDDANAAQSARPEARKPPSPASVAPASPARIDVPVLSDGSGADWRAWGKTYTDAIKAAKTVDEVAAWRAANADPLKNLAAVPNSGAAIKRIEEIEGNRLAELSQAPAKEAA